jgi:hypothetical protein
MPLGLQRLLTTTLAGGEFSHASIWRTQQLSTIIRGQSNSFIIKPNQQTIFLFGVSTNLYMYEHIALQLDGRLCGYKIVTLLRLMFVRGIPILVRFQ